MTGLARESERLHAMLQSRSLALLSALLQPLEGPRPDTTCRFIANAVEQTRLPSTPWYRQRRSLAPGLVVRSRMASVMQETAGGLQAE